MKQQYEHIFLCCPLIYIVKLTYNYEYIFLSFVSGMIISRVSNTTFLIYQFQFLTNVLYKTILINEITFSCGDTVIG